MLLTSQILFPTEISSDKINCHFAMNRPGVSLHTLPKQIREVTLNVTNPAVIHKPLAACSTAANDIACAHSVLFFCRNTPPSG